MNLPSLWNKLENTPIEYIKGQARSLPPKQIQRKKQAKAEGEIKMPATEIIRTANDWREALAAGKELYIRHYYGLNHYDIFVTEASLRQYAIQYSNGNGLVYFLQTTARELLDDEVGVSPDILDELDAEDREEAAWIVALAETHGWDTPLYRADYMNLLIDCDDDFLAVYDPTPIDELDALIAYANYRVYQIVALYPATAYKGE